MSTEHFFCDIHAHIVPGVDDGAEDLQTALRMLRSAESQGAFAVFATSHDYADKNAYSQNFSRLQQAAGNAGIKVKLYMGSEILHIPDEEERSIELLSHNQYRLNGTEYALIEFDTNESERSIMNSIKSVIGTGVTPIVAHAERYHALADNPDAIEVLTYSGAMLQVNAYSLVEERRPEIKELARRLIKDRKISFIGSDCHGITHRPPMIKSGVEYIYENCDKAYADEVCFGNAMKFLGCLI